VTKPKVPLPHYTVTAAVIRSHGKVFIAQRPAKGLLGNMWEFPGGKIKPGETLQDCLKREIREELNAEINIGKLFGIYDHAYTHFKITLHAFECQLLDGEELIASEHNEIRWVKLAELEDYPMGKIDRQIAQQLKTVLS
jgi:A/G-specific adenine glycosylase